MIWIWGDLSRCKVTSYNLKVPTEDSKLSWNRVSQFTFSHMLLLLQEEPASSQEMSDTQPGTKKKRQILLQFRFQKHLGRMNHGKCCQICHQPRPPILPETPEEAGLDFMWSGPVLDCCVLHSHNLSHHCQSAPFDFYFLQFFMILPYFQGKNTGKIWVNLVKSSELARLSNALIVAFLQERLRLQIEEMRREDLCNSTD